MAQSTLHFSIGMLVGSLLGAPGLWRARHSAQRIAPRFARLFAYAYGLGLFAMLPSIFRRIGMAETALHAGWMNVFLFYPLIERIEAPTIVLGELLIGALFAMHYLLLLLAIRRFSTGSKTS